MNIVIAGGGGFIGAHLAAALLAQGHAVRCVDRRPLDEWHQVKVIHAKRTGDLDVEIWGDGRQTRSFMYIDDCVKGTQDIMASDVLDPVNLGSNELTTIDGLVDVVEDIAGVTLNRRYHLDAPKGVNGRNSDNAMLRQALAWEPSIRLRDGMERTYRWIHDEYVRKYG